MGNLAAREGIPVGDIIIGSNAGRYVSNNTGLPTNSSSQLRVAIGNAAMSGDATYKHEHNLGDVAVGDRALYFKASSATGANIGQGVYIGAGAGRGYNNFRSSGNSAAHVCIGNNAMGNGGSSARHGQIAIGYQASIGSQTIETETYNTSTKGIAIGYESEGAAADYSNITRSGVGNIAIGVLAAGTTGGVIQGGTIAIGTSAMAQGSNSIAIGTNSDASSGTGVDNSIAIGFGAQATFANSVAIGPNAATAATNTIAFGSSSQNLGVVATSASTPSTHKWPVRINGVDYNILLTT